MLGVIIATCFGAWFTISVAAQFSDRVSERLSTMEALGLVPHWTFFAPRPSMHDVHLLFRDRLKDGKLSEIAYIPTIEVRRCYHIIWNPEKFRNKVIADVVMSLGLQFLASERRNTDLRLLMLSDPYLMAMHLVMQMPRPQNATARQFVLARHRSFGDDPDPQLVFVGEFHPFVRLA